MDPVPETLPAPTSPPSGMPDVLPPWHRDLSRIDPAWADAAAKVVALFSQSDILMVQANAKGKDGEQTALAYGALLSQMKQLEEETMRRGKESWIDNIHRKLLGRKVPLVERMEQLMRNRQLLVSATRQRIHGLREALDMRQRADDDAMGLLEAIPALEEKARHMVLQCSETLAGVSAEESFPQFREAQLNARDAQRLPSLLLGVRQQLQNAVLLGAPLRDAIDGFLHLEELNQTNFELTFGAHIGNLATLQGMQKSSINAHAAASALVMMSSLSKEGGSSFAGPNSRRAHQLLEKLGERRAEPEISNRPAAEALPAPVEAPRIRRPRL